MKRALLAMLFLLPAVGAVSAMAFGKSKQEAAGSSACASPCSEEEPACPTCCPPGCCN